MVFRQVSLPVVQGWEVLMLPDSLTYQQGSAGIWYQVPWLLVCWKCNVCPPPAPILNSPAPILSRAQRTRMTVYLRAWVWGQTALGSELTSPPTRWSWRSYTLFVCLFPHLSNSDNTASLWEVCISEIPTLWKLKVFFPKPEAPSYGIKIWPELTNGYLLYSLSKLVWLFLSLQKCCWF